jgi:hypothetical protein
VHARETFEIITIIISASVFPHDFGLLNPHSVRGCGWESSCKKIVPKDEVYYDMVCNID